MITKEEREGWRKTYGVNSAYFSKRITHLLDALDEAEARIKQLEAPLVTSKLDLTIDDIRNDTAISRAFSLLVNERQEHLLREAETRTEKAERERMVLARYIAGATSSCPAGCYCLPEERQRCWRCWLEWAAQEAEEKE